MKTNIQELVCSAISGHYEKFFNVYSNDIIDLLKKNEYSHRIYTRHQNTDDKLKNITCNEYYIDEIGLVSIIALYMGAIEKGFDNLSRLILYSLSMNTDRVFNIPLWDYIIDNDHLIRTLISLMLRNEIFFIYNNETIYLKFSLNNHVSIDTLILSAEKMLENIDTE